MSGWAESDVGDPGGSSPPRRTKKATPMTSVAKRKAIKRSLEEDFLNRRSSSKQARSSPNCFKYVQLKPFPPDVPTAAKWETWIDYHRKIKIQFERCEGASEKLKAGLLFTSIGEEVEKIITTRGMFPDESEVGPDFPYFHNMLTKLGTYFKSLSDETVNINHFASMKQLPSEGARGFETRLLRQAEICEMKEAKAMIRNRFIQGMSDREHAKRAFTDGTPLEEIVAAASRTEAYNNRSLAPEPLSNWGEQNKPLEVAALNQSFTRPNWRPNNSAQNSRERNSSDDKRCRNCGIRTHKFGVCPAIGKSCSNCDKKGHFAAMCRSKAKAVATVAQEAVNKTEDKNSQLKRVVQCEVGGSFRTSFLIDSGADVNIVSHADWFTIHDLFQNDEIVLYDYMEKSNQTVRAFACAKPLSIIASFSAWIEVCDGSKQKRFAKFLVVRGGDKSLISCSTAISLKILRLGAEINNVTVKPEEGIPDDKPFPKIPGEMVEFDIDPDVLPTKNAYYHIPAAFSAAAMERIRKMERQEIIEKVTKAPRWISGMSAVPKGPFDFRLIVNMRGPNRAIQRCYYRLPSLDEIQRKLAGARVFTKLDLTSAFHHVELAEDSRELTTFMAEDGMYRFTRLMFGVNCAPEKFQQIMERILRGINGVVAFIDDSIIFAKDYLELDSRTEQVLSAFRENNLTLNKDKCEFAKTSLTFLGHKISENGMNIDEEKVKSIEAFRAPKSSTELKSFLGLASYVSSFIPRFGDLTHTLWKVASTKPFEWSPEAEEAFTRTKGEIVSCTITKGYFSDTDTTIVYTDASPVALGAVLVQLNDEGVERVISFASKSLTPTEQRYPQTQREALGIVWAVEHFHYHLRGRRFTIRTDARGVAFIFNRERETSKRVMSRAQGFALRLSGFSFNLEFVKGSFNIADSPSRLYVGADREYTEDNAPWEIGVLDGEGHDILINNQQITIDEVRLGTKEDDTLQAVLIALKQGEWPENAKNFASVKEELYESNETLMKAGVVVVPMSLRGKILSVAHIGHPGGTAMRSILRERVWWPGMDRDAANHVENCNSCALVSRRGPPVPMARTQLPTNPWDLLAIDYNGPYARYGGVLIVVLVDCYSRYLIVGVVKSTDFDSLELFLESNFKRYGYPTALKSDNGPPYNGVQYSNYCASHGITKIHSTPLDPQQNGTAERYMQLVNKAMQIAALEERNYTEVLAETVRAHNSARHRVTSVPPEELMFHRKVRRNLPLASSASTSHKPEEMRKKDGEEKAQSKQREDRKRGARETKIQVGDTVAIMRTNRAKGDSRFDPTPWKVVAKHRGDLELETQDGRTAKRSVTMAKRLHNPVTETTLAGSIQQPDETARPTRTRKPPAHLDMYIRLLNGESPD